ncbi:L-serine ammonia-lyase (plasmid) [Vibrio pelagius]|uniref:L-serine dehydratase n=1 Tax=Vibrio pelagius TaxID=28169 RepID=A0ABY5GAL1_VIBPE|nr:L-serine ammonia-lyase [Vibrio pelagius]UTT87234.1 L-serine ammonia-lyase [Vibrio pelagius]
MSISVFDLFKVGVGPSSSHTVGPMVAANRFANELDELDLLDMTNRVVVKLMGSLSATGVGHGTDAAVIVGLMGELPDSVDTETIPVIKKELENGGNLWLGRKKLVAFDWPNDMKFLNEVHPYHPNALEIIAIGASGNTLYRNVYFSVGGGFILDEKEAKSESLPHEVVTLPYDFDSGVELLKLCEQNQITISQLMLENEKVWRSENDIREGLLKVWRTMNSCISNGLKAEGVLPGGLKVKRRAKKLYDSLVYCSDQNVISSTLSGMDWVNLYALAVNEENAAGGRMVTAPTNGAAGIIPAVLMYFHEFTPNCSDDQIVDFLLTSAAIGILCKKNASISGAEVGCQGEVGSACAMAAAGICAVLGGSPSQIENAAEIGLEHNLGLTCDPVGGLVQVPCIERNAIAAMKAINAAQMALRGNGEHLVSLDKVIKTMRDTGLDMQDKYKETSTGGLAVNVIEC